MRNGKLGGKLDDLSWCILLDVLLVVGELRALAKTDVALRRTVAGDVLKWAGAVRIDGCDGGLTADLCHGWAGKAGWRACDVSVGKCGGGEEAKAEDG